MNMLNKTTRKKLFISLLLLISTGVLLCSNLLQQKQCRPNAVDRIDLDHFLDAKNESGDSFAQHEMGGFYSPEREALRCGGGTPPSAVISRTAVLVPYRDREENLRIFLAYMHPFLQAQNLEYKIYVIHQAPFPAEFNRGALLNIGFQLANRDMNWSCVVLHDVDLLPENWNNVYKCGKEPLHLSTATNLHSYVLPYATYFGGVSAVTPEQFERANGFANLFYGWGGEDDDFGRRLQAKGYRIEHVDAKIGRYRALAHERQKENEFRYEQLQTAPLLYDKDGLNSINFTLMGVTAHRDYTNISVGLQRRPTNIG